MRSGKGYHELTALVLIMNLHAKYPMLLHSMDLTIAEYFLPCVQLNLWLLSCLLSFLSSPTYPTLLAWCNQYIIPSGFVISIIDIGIGAGNFSATWIGGLLFDNYGASAIFYLSLCSAIVMVVIIVPLQVYAHYSVKARDRQVAGVNSGSFPDREQTEKSPFIN